MVNKPAGSSKDAGSLRVPTERPSVEGDYFFVVLAVPVGAEGGADLMSPVGTWHLMRTGGSQPRGFQLQLSGTNIQSNQAFRLEVLDLDASFTSEAEVQRYLDGDGRSRVERAVDYRICRARIERREATGV